MLTLYNIKVITIYAYFFKIGNGDFVNSGITR